MSIQATSPTVVEATYDQWAFQIETHGYGCAVIGQSVIRPIAMTIALRKFRVREDGVPELSPSEEPSDYQVIDVTDLYALAATNTDVATALGALISAVGAYATSLGIL